MPKKSILSEPIVKKRILTPIEILAIVMGLLTVGLYIGVKSGMPNPVEMYLLTLIPAILFYGIALLVACVVLVSTSKVHNQNRLRGMARDERTVFDLINSKSIFADLRVINATLLCILFFQLMKNATPLVNPVRVDEILLGWERQFFNGRLASEMLQQPLHRLFGIHIARVMEFAYTDFVPYLFVLFAIMLFQGNRYLRMEFALAFGLLWLFGILMIYAYPTIGPAFVEPRLFMGIPYTSINDMRHFLDEGWKLQRNNPMSSQGYYLIAAFPNMHAAAVMLGSLFLQKVNIYLATISWLVFIGTVLSSLYFGWNYCIDVIGAALVAAFALQIARNWLTYESWNEPQAKKKDLKPSLVVQQEDSCAL